LRQGRSRFIPIIVFIVILLVPCCARADVTVDIWLYEDEFYEIEVAANLGDFIVGNYTVIDANVSAPIMLLVLDSDRFSDFANELFYVPHVYRYSMSSAFDFPVPYADTWHVVFWNDPINSGAKHVVGRVDHLTDVTTTTTITASPTTPDTSASLVSQLWIIIIGALGVVAAALIVLIWIIRRVEDTEYVSRYDLPRSEGGIFPFTDSG